MANRKDVSLRLKCPDGKMGIKNIKWNKNKGKMMNPYLKPWAKWTKFKKLKVPKKKGAG